MEVRDIQMKYTIDNPKLVENVHFFLPEDNFTGVVKDEDGCISYYENSKRHRTDGPAIKDGYYKEWWYNGKYYGKNNDFTLESWIKKCNMKIFE